MAKARVKLKRWEMRNDFRTIVYNKAIQDVDLATPKILKGVVKSAVKGRVDAARLALEVTGRHNPRGEHAPPSVVIAINGVPRPDRNRAIEEEVVDGEAEELTD
jgi:hypothetical protein